MTSYDVAIDIHQSLVPGRQHVPTWRGVYAGQGCQGTGCGGGTGAEQNCRRTDGVPCGRC